MATQSQIDANRRNAQRSTGPRTPEGKASVAYNALRHGFCSTLPRMHDEAERDTDALLAALIEENQPVGANELILVYQMAEYFLSQWRAGCFVTDELDERDSGEKNNDQISLMLRYHTTAARGFSRALADLRKLQKERKLQEIGFVSQKPPELPSGPHQPAAEPPAESPSPAAQPPDSQARATMQPARVPTRVAPTSASPAETSTGAESPSRFKPDAPRMLAPVPNSPRSA